MSTFIIIIITVTENFCDTDLISLVVIPYNYHYALVMRFR